VVEPVSNREAALRAALAGETDETACALCGCRLDDRARGDGGDPDPRHATAEREVVVVEVGDERAVCCGVCYREVVGESGLRPRRVFKTGDRRRVSLAGLD
jgi:hypothetical protein